jgi:riboflavin biosynthesis pyrimidine reductase
VEARIADLYQGPLPTDAGVVHVTSAWRAADGGLLSLAIGDATPASRTDAFVLALARARADALVTTGRILRLEPELSHAGAAEAELADWRREVMGRERAPIVAVLTSGRDLDLDHSALRGPQPRLIFTTPAAAERLDGVARQRGVELVADPAPSLRGLLRWLAQTRGCRSVVVEAGASTSADLYRTPAVVDELLLSICLAPSIPQAVRGPALPEEAAIADAGLVLASECERQEESGRWVFRRYCRR